MATRDKHPAVRTNVEPHPPKAKDKDRDDKDDKNKDKLDRNSALKSSRAQCAPRADASSGGLGESGHPPLDTKILKRLYYSMLKCRMVKECMPLLLRSGKRTSGRPSLGLDGCASVGLEAAQVGATMDLDPADTIAPSHGNLVTLVMKGTPLRVIYEQWFALQTGPGQGPSSPVLPSVVPPASTVATQLSVATGVALACKMQQKGNLVVALWEGGPVLLPASVPHKRVSDRRVSDRRVPHICPPLADVGFQLCHEALHFAGWHKLPIIYVLENNVSGSAPGQRKAAVTELIAKAQSCGIPAIAVDGNDVVACYRVNQEARLRARNGGGPTLIECQTYPWGAPPFREAKGGENHGDSETDICQNRADVGYPRRGCDPLLLMQGYLDQHQLWSEKWKQKITEEVQAQIEEAFQRI